MGDSYGDHWRNVIDSMKNGGNYFQYDGGERAPAMHEAKRQSKIDRLPKEMRRKVARIEDAELLAPRSEKSKKLMAQVLGTAAGVGDAKAEDRFDEMPNRQDGISL